MALQAVVHVDAVASHMQRGSAEHDPTFMYRIEQWRTHEFDSAFHVQLELARQLDRLRMLSHRSRQIVFFVSHTQSLSALHSVAVPRVGHDCLQMPVDRSTTQSDRAAQFAAYAHCVSHCILTAFHTQLRRLLQSPIDFTDEHVGRHTCVAASHAQRPALFRLQLQMSGYVAWHVALQLYGLLRYEIVAPGVGSSRSSHIEFDWHADTCVYSGQLTLQTDVKLFHRH